MRLVGDIGGTKALLGLVDADGADHFLFKKRFICASYADFTTLLGEFLSSADLPAGTISGACLALAGPVGNGGRSAKMTNLPWVIDADHLSRQFDLGPVVLINDFVAAALGVTTIREGELVTLQKGEPTDNGVRLVIGAGTGLGMALLIPQVEGWRVVASEGGHAAFAPADQSQFELWTYLRGLHERVEYEHCVSGPGLVSLYRFAAGAAADPVLLAAPDPAAAIALHAAQDPESSSHQATALFLAAYGAFSGDMALAVLARGGVFLAGGIAAKILPLMQSGSFMSAFNAKGKHSALTLRMPVHVVTDPELGLKGAAQKNMGTN